MRKYYLPAIPNFPQKLFLVSHNLHDVFNRFHHHRIRLVKILILTSPHRYKVLLCLFHIPNLQHTRISTPPPPSASISQLSEPRHGTTLVPLSNLLAFITLSKIPTPHGGGLEIA